MTRKSKARRKSPALSALRRFWLVLLAVLIGSAVAGFYGLRWKGFEPQGVRVSGNSIVPTQQIVRAAAIAGNRNLWLQDMRAAANRVETIPYVLQVTIQRLPPAQVTIFVQERSPFAVIESRSQTALLDQNLRVLSLHPDPSATLPTLTAVPPFDLAPPGGFLVDSRLAAMRDDALTLQAARVPLRELSFDRYRQLTVKLRSGIDVMFGDDADLAKKIPLVQPILNQTAHGRPIRAIDLRAIGTPVIVYK